MIVLFVGGPVKGLFRTMRDHEKTEVRVGFDPEDPERAALYRKMTLTGNPVENVTLASFEYVGDMKSAPSLIDFVTKEVADEQHES